MDDSWTGHADRLHESPRCAARPRVLVALVVSETVVHVADIFTGWPNIKGFGGDSRTLRKPP